MANNSIEQEDHPPRPTGGIFWNQKVWLIMAMVNILGIENISKEKCFPKGYKEWLRS